MFAQAIGLVALISMLASASTPEIEGRYEIKVTVRDFETGTDVEQINFIEIERRESAAIFFVYESWHANGHTCRLWGTAHERDRGVYEFVDEESADPSSQCRASIYTNETGVVLEDVDGNCREYHCGPRGQIGTDYFRFDSRIPLDRPVQVPW